MRDPPRLEARTEGPGRGPQAAVLGRKGHAFCPREWTLPVLPPPGQFLTRPELSRLRARDPVAGDNRGRVSRARVRRQD